MQWWWRLLLQTHCKMGCNLPLRAYFIEHPAHPQHQKNMLHVNKNILILIVPFLLLLLFEEEILNDPKCRVSKEKYKEKYNRFFFLTFF